MKTLAEIYQLGILASFEWRNKGNWDEWYAPIAVLDLGKAAPDMMAHIRQLVKENERRDVIIKAVKLHAVMQDCGRICDRDASIDYREQMKRSEAFVDGIMEQALAKEKPTQPGEAR